ncbi:MAG: ABC transporter permease [Acidimicrobiales bacterium]
MRSVLVIAAKDIAQRSRDRSAYIMGVVGPLALALILSATLGGVNDPSAFPLGLAADDDGQVVDGFGDLLTGLEADGVVVVTTAADRADLDRLVEDGEIDAGFHFAAGFGDAVQSAQPATITVVGDPGARVATDVAEAIAGTFAAELDYVTLATASVLMAEGTAGDPARAQELSVAALSQPLPIDLVPVETAGRGADLSSYYAVSLSVFFLFFSVQFGVLSLMEEREVGTLDRILMAPTAPWALMVGKMMSSFVIGVLSMVVLVVATTVVAGAEWGDPIAVGVLIVVGVVVAIALAMLVAAVAKTAEQATSFATAAALVLGLLGGAFFPVSRAGGLLARVSWLSPHRWLLDGFRDVSYGAGVGDLGTTLAVLGGFTVLVGGFGLVWAGRGLVRS